MSNSKRYSVYHVDQWGFESHGEILDEPGGGTLLADTDSEEVADLLSHSWAAGLAHHRHGPGQIIIMDNLIEMDPERVGAIRDALPLEAEAVLA